MHAFTNGEVLDRLGKDIIFLLYKQPFYAYILSSMKKVVNEEVPVAGVSVLEGVITLHINPAGYLRYVKEERVFILIHEVLHIMFYHHTRQGKRKHGLWNIATDISINQLIENDYARKPVDCLKLDSFQKKNGFTLPHGLNAEEYYEWLWQRKEKLEIPDDMQKDPFGENQGSGEDPSDVGASEPASSNSSSNNSSGGELSETDAGAFDKLHPTWKQNTDVSEQIQESIVRSAIKDAYTAANGVVPSNLKEFIQISMTSKTNWRAIFRNFTASKRNTNKRATWKRQNRRLGSSVMGYKKSRKLHVVVAVDTSMSITSQTFELFNAELIRVSQSGADIVLIDCDARVQSIEKYNPNKPPVFTGRGGTDFRPVFQAITEQKEPLLQRIPDVIIYLTDGLGCAPTHCSIPTLWCLTENGRRPFNDQRNDINWGTTLHISI